MRSSQQDVAVLRDYAQYIRKFPRIEAVTVGQAVGRISESVIRRLG